MGGQPSKPSDFVKHETDIKIKSTEDDYEIACKLWRPKGRIRAAALLIHGGSFSTGDRESNTFVADSLAAVTGTVIITASFRDGSSTTYETGKSISDLKAVVKYMKRRFYNEPFGVVGCSSGGFFAMKLCNEMDPGDIKFCIPLCPVSHPHARAIYLNHCIAGTTPLSSGKDLYRVRHTKERAQEIIGNQLQFFKSYKVMAEASDEVVENVNRVPTLVILANADKNVPSQVTQGMVDTWATRAIIVEGTGHEIHTAPPADLSKSYLPDVERFLRTVLKDDAYEPLWRIENVP